jgi:hypothetical protein
MTPPPLTYVGAATAPLLIPFYLFFFYFRVLL